MAPSVLLRPSQNPALLHKKTLPRCWILPSPKVYNNPLGLVLNFGGGCANRWVGTSQLCRGRCWKPGTQKAAPRGGWLSLESSSGPELLPLACQNKSTSRLVKNLGLSPGTQP